MIMLSDLLRFQVVDESGRRARLSDFAVDLSECDYPPVVRLDYRTARRRRLSLPWQAVKTINWAGRTLQVADLEAGSPAEDTEAVLLKRDVMDALVLDLQGRRGTRANDLWMEEERGALRICAADTTASAILHRLFRGRLIRHPREKLSDWKYMQFLRGDVAAAVRGGDCVERIGRLPPGEIARLSGAVPYLHAAELLTLLPGATAADVLEAIPTDRQLQVFEELDEETANRLLSLMRPDVAADLIGALEPQEAERYLQRMPELTRQRVTALLRYPGDTVGGIMTNHLIMAPESLTVAEALRVLRAQLREPDFVNYVYVVDGEETGYLQGILALRDLLVADENCRLREIMNPYVFALSPLEPAQGGAYRVLESEMWALPVIDGGGKLIGAVTVDSALAQVMSDSLRHEVARVFT